MTDAVDTGSTPTDSGTVAPATTAPEAPAATTLAEAAPAAEQTQVQPADKPADEVKTEAKEGETEAKADDKPGAPEEYGEFAMPEGIALDTELGGELKTIAKELNLTQEQAQKLADLGAKQAQKSQASHADALAAARETWANDAKADKEFGGEKFLENMAVAKKAVDAYASKDLKVLLDQTGLGNHPEMIRLFHKVGQTISEDRFDGGRRTPVGAQTTAERLYGTTTKQ